MLIEGPVGQLEVAIDTAPTDSVNAVAVLSHPHPQYGGSMHDAVLGCAVTALTQANIPCVRYNFRGVGASQGSFAQGDGECDDLTAVCAWTAQEFPNSQLYVAGYSFGAYVTYRTLATLNAARALLIAPPLGMMSFTDSAPDTPTHAVAGTHDDFVDGAKFAKWDGVTTELIDGADHFFGGYSSELTSAIARWVER